MQTDELLIAKTKHLFEENTGWGDSDDWTNQDFVALSEKIQERTGVALSHITLKRVWGKVKYNSLPNTHTLDTLAQFLGYENWRAFKSQNADGKFAQAQPEHLLANGGHYEPAYPFRERKAKLLRPLLILAAVVLMAAVVIYINAKPMPLKNSSIGPTAANALAADEELARAMQDNDTTGIVRMLDKGWAVIATTGGIAEGPSTFPDGIKSGYLTRKTFSISEPRVRLYGNTAVVTTKVELSGTFGGKPFDVTERQTDVWYWTDGAWKCILTHETKMSK